MRRPGARAVHLQHLQEHRVYEELDFPGSSRSRCAGWTKTTTARPKRECQRLRAGPDWAGELLQCDTAAGYVAYTAGRGTIVWAGHGSRGLRSGLPPSTHSRQERCMGHAPVGNCSGTWTSMASAQDLAKPETGGPAACGHHATKCKEKLSGLTPLRATRACTASCVNAYGVCAP